MSVLFKIELRAQCDDEKKYLLAKHVIKQVALQAYARVALLDDGPKPEIRACFHSDEGGQVDIPLVEFTRANDEEIAAMNARVGEALSCRCPPVVRRQPVRVIQGGKSPGHPR
jgi:hypothetical protein